MGYRKSHTSSAGARHATIPDFAEVTKGKPEKTLVERLKYNAGRNNQGRITCRHKGGRHDRQYRLIDFKRNKLDVEGTVKAIEYDPNRNCRIALIHYADGDKGYVLAAQGLEVGAKIISASQTCDPKVGCAMQLKDIPQGLNIHNVELAPGRGGQLARSAGTFARLMAIDGGYAILLLPSGEQRKVIATARATIGEVGNAEANIRSLGKAGRSRWLGIRPSVRGNAMNPIAHPLGGGEGHTNGGRQHCTPWGVVEGTKTRQRKNRNNIFIIRRRSGKTIVAE
jgi:large subunit ribosomal protein L2